jgi:large subunit ribosomal protein L9
MQLILLEKVANLGNLGDVVKVKDGYGRNFLIPQGKAKRATEANMAEFEAKKAEFEKQQAALLKAAQKSGVDGKLFGSVTNFDISEELTKAGHEVNKSEIRMPDGPLKTVGEHLVSVALHADVVFDITVKVLGDTD